MELWIRSQDKENTVKIINQYGLKYNDKKTIIANFQPDFTDKYDGYYEVLGTYKSKERALEVLDEIQNIIIRLSALSITGISDKNIAKEYVKLFKEENITSLKTVYEMPKE